MKTARLTRYEVSASLSASGFSPISAAIAGSDVVITVESMFSMNSAHATMRGMRTALRKGFELTGGRLPILPTPFDGRGNMEDDRCLDINCLDSYIAAMAMNSAELVL